MLRATVRNLVTPKGRNYTYVHHGSNRGRLSVDAVAEEIKRPVEYTRALLMPFPLSSGGASRSSVLYPSMYGRTSRPQGDFTGFTKAFPLFEPKPAFTKKRGVSYRRFTTE